MNQVSETRQPQICRLCLAKTLVFFPLDNNNETSKMLEALTTMRILSTDEISTVSCLKCLLNLKLAFATQQNMLRAEKKFRALNFVKQECEFQGDEDMTFESSQIDNFEPQSIVSASKPVQNTSKQWICDVCHIVKATRRLLASHKYNTHVKKQCPVCKKELSTGTLRLHVVKCNGKQNLEQKTKTIEPTTNTATTRNCMRKDSDGKAIWVCDVCNCVKVSRKSLKDHKYDHHVKKKCPGCQEELITAALRHHMFKCEATQNLEQNPENVNIKTENIEPKANSSKIINCMKKDSNGKTIWVCDVCNSVKLTRKTLNNHKYSHHVEKECPYCKAILSRMALKYHIVKCQKQKDLERKSEAEKYVDVSNIKTENVETDSNSEIIKCDYVCDICGITKLTKWQLSKHKYATHLRVKCPICEKVITKTNLKHHIERHKGHLAICEICGKTVKKQDIRKHYRSHSGITHKCRFCETSYKSKKWLQLHEDKEHLHKKGNYTCETCGKSFHNRMYLKKHVDSTHLKLRPHICEFCKVGFSTKFALMTHRRQHTNETPYKCEVCGEGFRQNVSLKGHLKSKHGIEEELTCECSVCGKKFASRAALISHSRVH